MLQCSCCHTALPILWRAHWHELTMMKVLRGFLLHVLDLYRHFPGLNITFARVLGLLERLQESVMRLLILCLRNCGEFSASAWASAKGSLRFPMWCPGGFGPTWRLSRPPCRSQCRWEGEGKDPHGAHCFCKGVCFFGGYPLFHGCKLKLDKQNHSSEWSPESDSNFRILLLAFFAGELAFPGSLGKK